MIRGQIARVRADCWRHYLIMKKHDITHLRSIKVRYLAILCLTLPHIWVWCCEVTITAYSDVRRRDKAWRNSSSWHNSSSGGAKHRGNGWRGQLLNKIENVKTDAARRGMLAVFIVLFRHKSADTEWILHFGKTSKLLGQTTSFFSPSLE